jgi:hypothetical protein
VKNNNLTSGLFAALLLSSPLVGADSKYPAADFQPTVVYQDSELMQKNTGATSAPSKATAPAATSQADSKYPAANFEPQVVYSDASYKPQKDLPEHKTTATKSSSPAEVNVEATEAAAPKAEASSNYLIGLIGLVLVGAFFLRNQFKCPKKSSENSAPAAAKNTYGLTGVARYLNKTAGTGVSRYLDKQVKSAATVTGVAKYMAKQRLAGKTASTEVATGVEKYMRNRG